MKDYSAMDDGAINMLVGESLGLTSYYLNHDCSVQFRNEKGHIKGTKNYCNNPADAWPIITANRISISFDGDFYDGKPSGLVRAHVNIASRDYMAVISDALENPLRAAMISYLQMMEQKK
jgi:hypothetical protein